MYTLELEGSFRDTSIANRDREVMLEESF
jgi:hypothetical protein